MFVARVFTLYPEFFPGPLGKGLYGKALDEKICCTTTIQGAVAICKVITNELDWSVQKLQDIHI